LNGKRRDVPPCDATQLANCEPIYKSVPGWKQSTHSARKMTNLPYAARHYLKYIAELTGARLSIVSIGPARGQTIFL
jgi:adenylosuccinate synthase